MKKTMLIIIAFGFMSGPRAQFNPADYFRLDIRQYKEDEGNYLGVSPEIRLGGRDTVAKGIARYPRRFRYILLNKTDFQNKYESYYPDTNRINQLFTMALLKDTTFMRPFIALATPFVYPDKMKTEFDTQALMKVAARFFYCDGVAKDSSILSHICINLNGIKELQMSKDMTLLEAFCFEAIFENFTKENGERSDFVGDFKKHIRTAEKIFAGSPGYLEKVRIYCFEQMEKNAALKLMLINYHTANKSNLPFNLLLIAP